MYEKVNPEHPDKVADRIAGAIVDEAYRISEVAHIAVEVLIGHCTATVIIESDVDITDEFIKNTVERIAKTKTEVLIKKVRQDEHLNNNQNERPKTGDNGIFKGVPTSKEEKELSKIARDIYERYHTDGKYIIHDNKLIICQSNADEWLYEKYKGNVINPLGEWTGGTNVDSGATNRKLGSDMGRGVTGGGLHGKDLSKGDVSINIYAFLKAQKEEKPIEICCAIGDTTVDGKDYSEIVDIAKEYIKKQGGFEKFAEWGLI